MSNIVIMPKFVVAEYFDGAVAAHNKIYQSLADVRDTIATAVKDCFKEPEDEKQRDEHLAELETIFQEIGHDEESERWDFTFIDCDYSVAIIKE